MKSPTYEIKIVGHEIEFFQSQNSTRWSYRLSNGYYHINYLLLADAMKHAEASIIRIVKNQFNSEIKKVKRKKIR